MRWFAIVLVACQAAAPVHFVAQPADLAIVDTTVIDVMVGREVPHQTIVVRGDRIVAVDAAGEIELPPGVVRVDGRGRYLMPGLFDMHVHLNREHDLGLLLAAGVTSVRNMAGDARHLEWRAQIAAGKRAGPTIRTAGQVLDGNPPYYPYERIVTTAAEGERAVEDTVRDGYDFVKLCDHLTVDAYDAIVAAAARAHIQVIGHAPMKVPLEHVLASGQRTIEHLTGYVRASLRPGTQFAPNLDPEAFGRAIDAAVDPQRLAALAQATARARTANCATLAVHDREQRMDDLEAIARDTPWSDFVEPEVKANWAQRRNTPEQARGVRAEYAIRERIVRALATAGAPLLVGSDAGNPYVIPGPSLHREIELLVAAGVDRTRVLRAATADAATALGLDAGVIAVGRRADLVLATASPLAGPIAIPPVGVYHGGTWRDHAALVALRVLARTERSPSAAMPREDGAVRTAPSALA